MASTENSMIPTTQEVEARGGSCAPAPGSAFWESPALKTQSKHYPERFKGRVPMRIRMLMNVRPDPWCGAIGQSGGPGTILRYDETYECWTNSHGAVAGICANGFALGVKPDEFEVVEWYMPNTEVSHGGDK